MLITPDVIGGIIGILISIFVFLEASKFPKDVVMGVGPSYFPNMLAVGMLLASGIFLINALLGRNSSTYEKLDIKDKGVQRAVVALIATIVFCVLLNTLGFIICSIVYLFFLMYLLKNRKYLNMIIVSVAVTMGVYLLFKIVLNITLPVGILSI